jgi:hypothetical protein
MYRSLTRALTAKQELLEQAAATAATTADRKRTVDRLLTAQRTVYVVSGLILDVTSAIDGIKGGLDKIAKDKPFEWHDLDEIYELAKDAEGALDGLSRVVRDADAPGGPISQMESAIGGRLNVDRVGIERLGSVKSHVSDIVNAYRDFSERAKIDARDTAELAKNFESFRFNILQLAGRISRDILEDSIKDRRAFADELARDIAAENAALGAANAEFAATEARRSQLVDTIIAVREALRVTRDCSRGCPTGVTFVPPLKPDFGSAAASIDGRDAKWGEELRYYNSRIPMMRNDLGGAPLAVSGRVCRGAPVTLVFNVFDKVPSNYRPQGGSLVGAVNDVTARITARPESSVGGTYSLTFTPLVERSADGKTTVRFEVGDPNVSVDTGMPAAKDQAARRELNLLQARLRRASLPVGAAGSAGMHSVDLRSTFGQTPQLGTSPASMDVCASRTPEDEKQACPATVPPRRN